MTDPIEAAIREAADAWSHFEYQDSRGEIPNSLFESKRFGILRSLVSTVRALEREATLEETEGVCDAIRAELHGEANDLVNAYEGTASAVLAAEALDAQAAGAAACRDRVRALKSKESAKS